VVLVARKGANAAVLFVLARVLGASSFGAYSLVISILTLLSVLSLFGLERLSAREIAKYLAVDDFGKARGFLVWSLKVVVSASLAVTILTVLSMMLYQGGGLDPEVREALEIGALLILAMALLTLAKGILRGFHRPVYSHVPESIVKPGLLLLAVATLYFLDIQWSATVAVYALAGATLVALGLAAVGIVKNTPDGLMQARSEQDRSLWIRSAATFSANSLFLTLNEQAVVIMLGFLVSTTETGTFKLAASLAGLISFVQIAINVPLGPTVAQQLARGEKAELQKTVTQLARLGFLLAVPMSIGCWIFGHWMLGLFGNEFVDGYPTLMILALSQLFSVAMGSVASVLVNAGFENLATRAIVIGTVLNLVGAAALIPFLGATGAAIGLAAGSIITNALMVYYAADKAGLDTSVLGSKLAFARVDR